MSGYGWLITEDYVAGTYADESGTMGPQGLSRDLAGRLERREGMAFRLLDGDGGLCYMGLYLNRREPTAVSLAPLDDFGGPNAGCTDIQFLANGVWRSL